MAIGSPAHSDRLAAVPAIPPELKDPVGFFAGQPQPSPHVEIPGQDRAVGAVGDHALSGRVDGEGGGYARPRLQCANEAEVLEAPEQSTTVMIAGRQEAGPGRQGGHAAARLPALEAADRHVVGQRHDGHGPVCAAAARSERQEVPTAGREQETRYVGVVDFAGRP